MIKRPDNPNQRVLPPVSGALYGPEQDGPSEVVEKALGLAQIPRSPWQAFRAEKKAPNGTMAQLLYHHKMAVTAERAQAFNRADFYWRRLYTHLNRATASQALLDTLDARLSPDETAPFRDAAHLFHCLINELFIDTHCAFYNGLMEGPAAIPMEARARVHMAHIQNLMEPDMSCQDRKSVLDPAYRALCQRHKSRQDPTGAARIMEAALDQFPDDLAYQDELCGLYVSDALAWLSGSNDDRLKCIEDAKRLAACIEKLETFRRKYPCNVLCYQLLGEMHYLHAAKLANGELYAEALLAIEKSLAFNPFSTHARENRAQLVKLMKDLQAQMQEVMTQIARHPGKTLNAAGLRWKKQVTVGFGLVNDFIESEAAVHIQDDFCKAYARQNWLTIGLAVPDEGWTETAGALLGAIDVIVAAAPQNETDVAAAWADAAAANPQLSMLDADLICAYLVRRIRTGDGAAEPDAESDAETGTAAPDADPADYPVIATAASQTVPDQESFGDWLLSSQGWRLKLQTVAAVVLVLIAGVVTLHSRAVTAYRDSAYARIVAASLNLDYPEVIRQAEIFLTHRPLRGRDSREPMVMDLYNEAMVRWVMQTQEKIDPNAGDHIQRYRELANNWEDEV